MTEKSLAERVAELELHHDYQKKFQATLLDEVHAMNLRLQDVEKKIWLAAGAIAIIQVFIVPWVQSLFKG